MQFDVQFDKKLLLCLAIFAAFSIASLFLPFFSSDEYGYMSSGREIVEGKFAEIGDVNRFPLFPFTLSIVYSVFGYSELITKIFLMMLGFATIILFHAVAKSALSEEAAFISTLIFASNPLFLYLSTRVLTEPLFFLLLIACVYYVAKALENKWNSFILGLLCAGLVLTRYSGALILPAIVIYLFLSKEYRRLSVDKIGFFVLGSAIVAGLWMWFSYNFTGDPFGLLLRFFSQQTGGLNEAVFSLPDKLPLYLIALPFLLLFATPFLWNGAAEFFKGGIQKNKTLLLAAIVSVVFYAGLEVYGFFNVALLRYIVPIIPFLALFAGNVQLPFKVELPFKFGGFVVDKKMLYAAVVLNLLLAASVFVFFASYPKYVGYREAGQWAAENCDSFNSNIQKVLKHYSDKDNEVAGECTVVSSYDGALPQAPGQRLVFESHGVKVYK